MTVARAIVELRSVLDLNAVQLGEELGVSKATVYAWEEGSSTPQRVHLARLSRLAKDRNVGGDVVEAFESAIVGDAART